MHRAQSNYICRTILYPEGLLDLGICGLHHIFAMRLLQLNIVLIFPINIFNMLKCQWSWAFSNSSVFHVSWKYASHKSSILQICGVRPQGIRAFGVGPNWMLQGTDVQAPLTNLQFAAAVRTHECCRGWLCGRYRVPEGPDSKTMLHEILSSLILTSRGGHLRFNWMNLLWWPHFLFGLTPIFLKEGLGAFFKIWCNGAKA